jgi:uncharacterized protein YndB with AHSA1/START domain
MEDNQNISNSYTMRSQRLIATIFRSIKMLLLVSILYLQHDAVMAQPLSEAEKIVTKEKILGLYIRVNAPLDSVWERWSTAKGLRKFFAPACTFEPKVLSPFEILFAPNAPEGQRGAENNRILAIQDKQMISFTWDAPPQWPDIRKNRTTVAVRFYKVDDEQTLVTLTQTGWGIGPEWDTVYTYFVQAWGGFVLPNLKYSLEVKPIDWTDFPKNAPQGLKPADKF